MQALSETNSAIQPGRVHVIKPDHGWKFINFSELREYRDLFVFLVWRDIKVLYAQTILGFAWAILQPLTQIVIFSIVFGKVAKISTGDIPYVVFSSVAIVPWTYLSHSINVSSQSLVSGTNLLGKVYFPRLIFPITPVLARLVDFAISLVIVLGIMLYFRIEPTWRLALLPLMIVYMVSISAGIGIWLSSMAIRFRDVKYALPFCIQMLMYSAPIVYSAARIPQKYRMLYSINPVVGVIEGFRSCMLGSALPLEYIFPGVITALLVLFSGALYFRRMERVFVDVI